MDALILVDLQNDFCPGGALPVPEGDQIMPLVNRLQGHFDLVVATQDRHPAGHGSFAVNHDGGKPGEMAELAGLPQMLWPSHCVEGTPGAEFHPALDTSRIGHVVAKGADPTVDSYSGFFDNGRRNDTGLGGWLRERGIDAVDVCGLALDYCVKFTAIDAARLGFCTSVVVDACRAVDVHAGDGDRALEELRRAGVAIVGERERSGG